MLRTVDKINGFIIQKVLTPKRVLLGYQVVKEGEHDASSIRRFPHLSSARLAAHQTKAVQEAATA